MSYRLSPDGQRIYEYNDTHIFRKGDWAVNTWDVEAYPIEAGGPCITHWCHQPIYDCKSWNYVVSPKRGNMYWDRTASTVRKDSLYRCTECGTRCPLDIETIFELYK